MWYSGPVFRLRMWSSKSAVQTALNTVLSGYVFPDSGADAKAPARSLTKSCANDSAPLSASSPPFVSLSCIATVLAVLMLQSFKVRVPQLRSLIFLAASVGTFETQNRSQH